MALSSLAIQKPSGRCHVALYNIYVEYMCGRYPEPFQYKYINKYFAAVAKYEEENSFTPRYNIAPTQLAPIVREDDDERIVTFMRWGLVPHWAKDVSIGNRMINARAETLTEKPAYRKPFL